MKAFGLFSLLFLLISGQFVWAQESCGNEHFEQHAKLYPEYFREYEKLTHQPTIFHQRSQGEAVISIPIVVHVLHTGEPIGQGANISDKQIFDAIQKANEEWRNASGNSTDMNFQFCLASKTPQGQPTNGIVRVDASHIANYKEMGMSYSGSAGANEVVLKNLSNWDHNYVYNIWIVNKISNVNVAAFAYYPLSIHFSFDGATVSYQYMDKSSSSLAHELGHALGLYHTFEGSEQGCPINTNCANNGDKVCDTPPHLKYDCYKTDCSNSDLENSFSNIMSYCWPRVLFTLGQKNRTYSVFNSTVRKQLLNSKACQKICDTIYSQQTQYLCGSQKSDTVVHFLKALNGCDSIHTMITHYLSPLSLQLNVDSISTPYQYKFSIDTSQLDNINLQWYVNDTLVATSAWFVLTVEEGKYYKVKLIGENVCGQDTVEMIVDKTISTSISEHSMGKSILVYPNPSDGDFILALKNFSQGDYSLMIFDELGRVVMLKNIDTIEKQVIQVNQCHIVDGVYQLLILKDGIPIEATRLVFKKS
ncbi:MAG: zinc-dependent metalloprotease [Chitinophagales bacterium]|nr:zinc-dependent metalloprotease [Chitinophagales bacterium]